MLGINRIKVAQTISSQGLIGLGIRKGGLNELLPRE
jgi:hypothetical protein